METLGGCDNDNGSRQFPERELTRTFAITQSDTDHPRLWERPSVLLCGDGVQ